MNREDIIRMAQEAGGCTPEWDDFWEFHQDALERFAAFVAAAEREACAKACEARKIIDPEYEYDRHYNQAAEHCAFAIRARGEQEQPR